MKSLVLSILVLVCNNIYAQLNSYTLDSISKKILAQHPNKKFRIFSDILKERSNKHLSNRIDSINCDYIFIIEKFNRNNSRFQLNEFYFNRDDSFAKFLYFDTVEITPNKYYDRLFSGYFYLTTYQFTLYELLRTFNSLKPFQTLTYDPNIIVNSGCVRNIARENKHARLERKHRKNRLRSTYQILTLIDKRNNRILTSFQIPPTNFHFETKLYFPVWDF